MTAGATRKRTWNVLGHPVCGFLRADREREHVRAHFLASEEQWEDLRPTRTPAEHRTRIDAAGDDPTAWLEVAEDYIELIARYTTGQAIDRHHVGPYQGKNNDFDCLWVVSQIGLLTAFVQTHGQLSHLATSYRPLPRVRRGRLSAMNFRDEARRKLRGLRR